MVSRKHLLEEEFALAHPHAAATDEVRKFSGGPVDSIPEERLASAFDFFLRFVATANGSSRSSCILHFNFSRLTALWTTARIGVLLSSRGGKRDTFGLFRLRSAVPLETWPRSVTTSTSPSAHPQYLATASSFSFKFSVCCSDVPAPRLNMTTLRGTSVARGGSARTAAVPVASFLQRSGFFRHRLLLRVRRFLRPRFLLPPPLLLLTRPWLRREALQHLCPKRPGLVGDPGVLLSFSIVVI